jgi:hypothetical protein
MADRMRNVAESAVGQSPGGHGQKEPVASVDQFDVMKHKFLVKGYGNHGFQAGADLRSPVFNF